MTVILLTLIFLLIFIFYAYFLRKRNYWKNKKIPHIKPTAVLGNFGDYIFLKKFVGQVEQEICQTFPDEPYVGAFYGSEPVLIVQDPELIKLVMTKDFYYFNSREIANYTQKEVMTQNIFFTYGDRWKVIRQNLTPVFSSAKMKNMFHLIQKCCYGFEELLDSEAGNVVEVRSLTSRFTMDCIGACAFGIDTKTMDKGHSTNAFFVIGHKILEATTPMALKWITRAMWPAVFYGLGLKTFPKEGDAFFKQILIEVFKGREYAPSNRHDFVDYLLTFKNNKHLIGDSMTNAKTGGSKKVELEADDDLLVGQCLAFFLAGFETSSTILSFTLFELAKNKEAQKRVLDEIDDYLQRHGNVVNYEVVKELPYTEACLDETMRLYPVLAVLTRELVEDYAFPTGLRVEKGLRVHIPVYHMHLNPEHFPEPKKFKPERFLPEQRQHIKPYTYMPFGEGPRICIGSRFAKMQMLAGLVTLLKRFEVVPAEGAPREVKFEPRGIVTQAAEGIHVKLMPRPLHQQKTFAPIK